MHQNFLCCQPFGLCLQVSPISSEVPAADASKVSEIQFHRISCMISLADCQASWCQLATSPAHATAWGRQHTRCTAARSDVVLREDPQALPLLLYDHWQLQSLAVQVLYSGVHTDMTVQITGASWDADWLELPVTMAGSDTVEESSSFARQYALKKVMQWDGNMTDSMSSACVGMFQGASGVSRFELTDPDLMPCSHAVAEGDGDSRTSSEIGHQNDLFHAAESIEQSAAFEIQEVMAGCCHKHLLNVGQLDCTAHNLHPIDDIPESSKPEVITVDAKVFLFVDCTQLCVARTLDPD